MDKISVLIVDDSSLMRNLISRIVDDVEELEVVAKAMNGSFGLEKIEQLEPDIVILDIEMPVMNGIEFLKERKKRGITVPVIMMSSLTTQGASITMECMSLGASDFVTKPAATGIGDLNLVANRLVECLLAYGGQYARRRGKKIPFARSEVNLGARKSTASQPAAEPTAAPIQIKPLHEGNKIDIIAIGISTGGPNSLRQVFKDIAADLSQPILVVQHMPAGFTAEFAKSLDTICPLEVKEAEDGEPLKGGRILIAPGDFHLGVEKGPTGYIARLSDAPMCNGHRPSADFLFHSVGRIFENRILGVIMTGMGRDGAAGLAALRKQGAHTLGQDEESSIVYGMPKVAYELGGVEKQVPLSKMAAEISAVAKKFA